nr:hypothetical protein [Chromatiaceae bacterium]
MNRGLGARGLVDTSHPFRLAVVFFIISLVALWTLDSRAEVPDPPPPAADPASNTTPSAAPGPRPGAGTRPLRAAQRAQLARHPKLFTATTVLAPLDQGLSTTPVIVSLRPSAEGETLAALSRLSPRAPAGAPPPAVRIYYDLQDEPIRAQLRASVSQALDRVLSALDRPGLALTQRFAYQYGFAAQVTAAALHRMLAHPDVVRVEPDRPLIPARPNPDHDATEPRTSTAASHPDEPAARASALEQDAPPATTMAALITQWERFIDRLDEAGDPPLPPVLAAGLGGQPVGGPGACDPRLPALAQAAANAEAAGISLFAPAGDDGD